VLNQDAIFEKCNLGFVTLLPNRHDSLNRLTAREELGLGQNRCTTSALIAALASALLFGFDAG
jgi:hypothetical protein